MTTPPTQVSPIRRRAIAIIGSFRQHYRDVLAAWATFRAAGWIITSPLGSRVIEEGIPFVRFELDDPGLDDATVQTLALHRIMRADLTYVVAPGGYVGRTTCYELGRVLQAQRPVYFSAQPADLPLAIPVPAIASPDDVVQRFQRTEPSALFGGAQGTYAAWERRLCTGSYLDG